MLGPVLEAAPLLVGVALIVWGAERFAEHLAAASARLGVTTFALALLLAGAEPEELATGSRPVPGTCRAVAFGDVVGANAAICPGRPGRRCASSLPLPFFRATRRYAALALPAGGARRRRSPGTARSAAIEGAVLVAALRGVRRLIWGRRASATVAGRDRRAPRRRRHGHSRPRRAGPRARGRGDRRHRGRGDAARRGGAPVHRRRGRPDEGCRSPSSGSPRRSSWWCWRGRRPDRDLGRGRRRGRRQLRLQRHDDAGAPPPSITAARHRGRFAGSARRCWGCSPRSCRPRRRLAPRPPGAA